MRENTRVCKYGTCDFFVAEKRLRHLNCEMPHFLYWLWVVPLLIATPQAK